MPETMINCCFTEELEEVANRLLPPEIFAEIGTTASAGTCCSGSHAVIEGLAMHLISILGLADMRTPEHQPPQANAILSINQHISRSNNGNVPQGFGEINDVAAMNMPLAAPLRAAGAYQPKPARQYNNDMGITGEFMPMRRQNASGTGVFFPRGEVCHTRSSKSPGNNGKCAS